MTKEKFTRVGDTGNTEYKIASQCLNLPLRAYPVLCTSSFYRNLVPTKQKMKINKNKLLKLFRPCPVLWEFTHNAIPMMIRIQNYEDQWRRLCKGESKAFCKYDILCLRLKNALVEKRATMKK